MTLNSLHD